MDRSDHQRVEAVQSAMAGHFAEVKTDLLHVQSLLSEAISGLLDDAMAISEVCAQQEQALAVVNQTDQQALLDRNQTISKCAHSTMVHLQFQDMVNQLLDHAIKRLDTVEALGLVVSGPSGASSTSEAKTEDHHEVARLLATSTQIQQGKPVRSTDMQAGDIELF